MDANVELKTFIEIASLPFGCRWERRLVPLVLPTRAKVPGSGALCSATCLHLLLNLINFSKCTVERQVASFSIDRRSCAALICCSSTKMQTKYFGSNGFSLVAYSVGIF